MSSPLFSLHFYERCCWISLEKFPWSQAQGVTCKTQCEDSHFCWALECVRSCSIPACSIPSCSIPTGRPFCSVPHTQPALGLSKWPQRSDCHLCKGTPEKKPSLLDIPNGKCSSEPGRLQPWDRPAPASLPPAQDEQVVLFERTKHHARNHNKAKCT